MPFRLLTFFFLVCSALHTLAALLSVVALDWREALDNLGLASVHVFACFGAAALYDAYLERSR